MAISREKKEQIVDNIADLLSQAKMIVLVNYSGVNVPQIQQLRRAARKQDVRITVAKNRLVEIALSKTDSLKDVDTSILKGQIATVFGLNDEVAPAQVIAEFAKTQPELEFVGAYTADGKTLSADQVTELSKLPGKEALRGQLVGTVAAPLSGFMNVISGNLRGLVNVLNAHAANQEG